MGNLPKNVINKIMFFTSHPVADIVRESSIFKFMTLIHNEKYRMRGPTPYLNGVSDALYKGLRPQKFLKPDYTKEERDEYNAAYLHDKQCTICSLGYCIFWSIRPTEKWLADNDPDSDSEFEPDPETDETDGTETVSDDVPETIVDHEMT